jgi:16S rRNA processing protein RimM
MSSPLSEYTVQVGRVVSAYGLRGDLRIVSLTDVAGRWQTLRQVAVHVGKYQALHELTLVREEAKGTLLVRLSGVADRTAAEKLRGAVLLVREQDSPTLPPGEYYMHQIIGLQVVTRAGRKLGPVTDVLQTGANDVYVTPGGLIPAIREVVVEIDLAAGQMIIEPMPGMLEETEATDAG